jgi:hypothetical protein
MRRASLVLPALLLCCLPALRASAQEPSLAAVLQRAAVYVADFHRQLSSIVAEERYSQDWRSPSGRPFGRRALVSDLLLVKPSSDGNWMEFRDVFEVDGQPIRERDDRLVKMFLEPTTSTAMQVSKILNESARFNIGGIQRNVNTPVFPLQYLEAANQPRFRFKRSNDRKPNTMAVVSAQESGVFRVSSEVWVVSYDETRSDTMIKTGMRQDLPSHGRFWIDPFTGRVLMSELWVNGRGIQATIDVSFQSEPLLGMLVPIEMREHYLGPGEQVEGRASYGRFRQFQVNVDEKLAPIKR